MVGSNVQVEVHISDKIESKMLIPIPLAMLAPFALHIAYASIYLLILHPCSSGSSCPVIY